MRVIFKEIDLLLEFWDEIIEYNIYIHNLTDTRLINNNNIISPQETYTSIIFSIDYIRI
jgi:hypothetical protein